jgi:hypothetical protein
VRIGGRAGKSGRDQVSVVMCGARIEERNAEHPLRLTPGGRDRGSPWSTISSALEVKVALRLQMLLERPDVRIHRCGLPDDEPRHEAKDGIVD